MGRRLDGKVAVITGTAGGQGRSAAEIFAREGAKVVGCDIKAEENRETRGLVEAAGGTMLGIEPADLTDPAVVEELIALAVREYGGIDIVYNNASSQMFKPFADISLEEWSFVMENDLNMVFYVTRAAWPHLVARGGGSVIVTSSTAAIGATRTTPTVAHSTAKAGVLGFTRALAAEGAPHQIRVNGILPGLIETPVLKVHLTPDEVAAMGATIPLGRIGQPEDIVNFALYLASDESTFVTAQTFVIDGGQSIIQ